MSFSSNKPVGTELISIRPWGELYRRYANADSEAGEMSEHYLVIKPGESISLHMHSLRREWHRLLSGKAILVLETEEIPLVQNVDSPLIRPGVLHQLRSNSDEPAIIREIALGKYLHTDIDRWSDPHHRPLLGREDPELCRNDGILP